MAFNFNWSPLTTDENFYTRAQELLTTALNKSPRPPIIVDDIIVTDINLGHVPPHLEILEIGDLAEDRFRGIFKMSYNGDASLTLKTRVQANPLNTHLSTRSAFASPQPLAAATGLTIPLQITLSDIKLSAFIVVVFSRQKGLTLVFRNDPLESLKVSSTFDSIPFVRDYLQKEIDGQLRILFMDQLPAIIHRLSLRLWVPEYRAKNDQELAESKAAAKEEAVVDPLLSPPQDAVDSEGNPINPSEIANMSLDSTLETQSLFSQKNLLRLAALNDSHRTLSLFTPSIRDTVFRAWAGSTERSDSVGIISPRVPALSRSHSYAASTSTSTTYTFADNASQSSRSQLGSYSGLGGVRHSKPHHKRKKRVVNLRKKAESSGDGDSVFSGETESYTTESVTGSETSATSVFTPPPMVPEESVGGDCEISDPPSSPLETIRMRRNLEPVAAGVTHPQRPHPRRSLAHAFDLPERSRQSSYQRNQPKTPEEQPLSTDLDDTPRGSRHIPSYRDHTILESESHGTLQSAISDKVPSSNPLSHVASANFPSQRQSGHHTSVHTPHLYPSQPKARSSHGQQSNSMPAFLQFVDPSNSASIAEQAWMMKLANELAKRYQVEKEKIEKEGPSSAATAPLGLNNMPSNSTTGGLGLSAGASASEKARTAEEPASSSSLTAGTDIDLSVTPPPAYAA